MTTVPVMTEDHFSRFTSAKFHFLTDDGESCEALFQLNNNQELEFFTKTKAGKVLKQIPVRRRQAEGILQKMQASRRFHLKTASKNQEKNMMNKKS